MDHGFLNRDIESRSTCGHSWYGMHDEKHSCHMGESHRLDLETLHQCRCGATLENATDASNDFGVDHDGRWIWLGAPIAARQTLSREEALRLAAWLVRRAGDDDERFARVLAAVRSV